MSETSRTAGLTTVSDEELACRAQRGCEESLDQLLRRFQVPLLHFLRRRGHAADAEDLLQETFLRAFENLHRYRPRWAFAAWLFTIARRTGINHRRRARPAGDAGAVAAVAAPDGEPLAGMLAAEDRRRLWRLAEDRLSEEQHTALWLHYVEDMPVGNIALVLGRTRTSVKVMLHRARKKLMPLLKDIDGQTSIMETSLGEKPPGRAETVGAAYGS
jgi:RNA polymerase sigma-70 factor (ECF subfamily)